jgi:hypothetical protein
MPARQRGGGTRTSAGPWPGSRAWCAAGSGWSKHWRGWTCCCTGSGGAPRSGPAGGRADEAAVVRWKQETCSGLRKETRAWPSLHRHKGPSRWCPARTRWRSGRMFLAPTAHWSQPVPAPPPYGHRRPGADRLFENARDPNCHNYCVKDQNGVRAPAGLSPRVSLSDQGIHLLWRQFVGCADGNAAPAVGIGGTRCPDSRAGCPPADRQDQRRGAAFRNPYW